MLRVVFMLFFVGLVSSLNGQQNAVRDSLFTLLQTVEGEDRFEPLFEYVEIIIRQNSKESVKYLNELKELGREYKGEQGVLRALFLEGIWYKQIGDFEKLDSVTAVGIPRAQAIDHKRLIGQMTNLRGIRHEKAGNLDSAIYYYNLSMEEYPYDKMQIYNNLGVAYNRKGEPSNAVNYLLKAMEEAVATEDKAAEAVLANNVGNCYKDLKDFEKMEYYCLRSIELKGEIGDERGKLFALRNLSTQPEFGIPKRLAYLNQAKDILNKLDEPFFDKLFKATDARLLTDQGKNEEALLIANELWANGEAPAIIKESLFYVFTIVHQRKNDKEKLKEVSKQLMQFAEEIGNTESILNAQGILLDIYQKEKNKKAYFDVAVDYFPLRDSLRDQGNLDKLASLTAELQNADNEKEIAVLNAELERKELIRNASIAIGVLVAFILGLIIYYRNQKLKRQTSLLKKEKQLANDLAEVNEELKNIDKVKTRFFANISHELRTPITLISTPLAQIDNKFKNQLHPEVQGSLGLVNNNVKRLNQLVEELLEISKLDAGKQELELQPLYLYPYLRQLFYAFESAAETKNISYQFDYQLKEDLVVAIDPKRFSKIVNNLLSNAIKFTPKDGKIEMRITEIPNADYRNIKIEVEDSGRGIPPEDMEHVFDRYFQTKRKSIPTEGGTGIGLALAKELAQLMQGDLNVKSEWGKGSSFTFTMLAEEKDASIAVNQEVIKAKNEQSQKTSTVSINQNLPKVLIVEDNLDMQQLISSILSDDYQCVIADNGEEAWNMLQHNDPKIKDVQLMVSDLMMPIMDGFSLLEKVKQDENWRHLPVIMLTARSSEETKLKALRLGVDDYLSKPFSPDELLARTSNLLDNFLQKKEYREEQQKLDVAFEEVSSADQQWLAEIEEAALDALEKKMELNSAYLSEKMLLSERQLLRKLKALTGLSIKKYVQEIRLQKARHLLENKVFNTVSEVAYACGINTPSYLSKLYLNRFGKRPAEYLEQLI